MNDGVIAFADFKGRILEWGFYLNGIEYGGYNVRETARNAYRKCKKDMFNLFKKYGCSDGQYEYKKLAREFKKVSA